VLFLANDEGRTAFVRWDVVSDRFELIARMVNVGAWLSPDGRWILCLCARDVDETPSLLAFPVDDPGAVRGLGVQTFTAIGWRPTGEPAPALALRARQHRIELAMGTEETLLAMVVDATGDRILLPRGALRWSIRDPAIAAVDSMTGRITAKRPGHTIATVDFGVPRDTVEVVVNAETAMLVLDETWRTIDSTRWLEFGAPRPRLITARDGSRGLNNNGDGSYASGVFIRDPIDPSTGIGIEARLSLPITRSELQNQLLSIRSARVFDLAAWDRRTTRPRLDPKAVNDECLFGYPAGVGLAGISRLGFQAGGLQRFVPTDSSWPTGAWHRVRIQLFPDGTCGFAIDGVAQWRSPSRVPIDTSYRVWISGSSVETSLVVGPVQVWRGVRPDVDWRAADAPAR
jgi:hypothetical protein